MATDDRAESMPTGELVLLHGFTHTGASWDAIAGALGDRLHTIAPDIRGHGRASGTTPVSLRGVIGDVAAVARGDYVLGGYSMGGRLALHAALADGVRVRRLVLVGASPGIADGPQREARRIADERLAAEIERLTIEAVADLWDAQTTAGPSAPLAGQPAGVQRAVRADRLRNSPVGLAAALRGLGTGALPSVWHRLHELRMPVTLIVGERDLKFREIAVRMAARIADVRVVAVPGAGHAAHLEAPEVVAELIAEFAAPDRPA